MPTLIYSPGVRVFIGTRKEGVIDVTDDLIRGRVELTENEQGRFSIALANHKKKYDRVFTPNDRISIQMKRLGAQWLQIFSGYLSEAPYFSAYPRTIPLSGSCTLKRLYYWLWDPWMPESTELLTPGTPLIPSSDILMRETDQGIAARIRAVLQEVGQWPRETVHIGQLPQKWVDQVAELYAATSAKLGPEEVAVPTQIPTVGGSYPAEYGTMTATPDPNAPTATGTIPPTRAGAGRGKASWFGGPGGGAYGNMALSGESGSRPGTPEDPQGLWYCAMRFPYMISDPGTGDPKKYLSPAEEKAAMNWWRGRRLLVVNPNNLNAIVVRAADWGPHISAGAGGQADIDLSQHALEVALGAKTLDVVDIRFAPLGAPLGPWTPPAPAMQTGGLLGVGNLQSWLNPASTTATASSFVALAQQQLGDAYVWGSHPSTQNLDPTSFDCSGLVAWAASRMGLNMQGTAATQYQKCRDAGQEISVAQASQIRGALLFHTDLSHVAISLGDGKNTIEAMGTKYGVVNGPIGNRFGRAGLIPQLKYDAPGAGATGGPPTELGLNGGPEQAINNTATWSPIASDEQRQESENLTGPRALYNDENLINTVQMLCKVSLRSFMAAPNGDFIAWFPDYFGYNETAGRIKVETIELMGDGFTVEWSDSSLITHQFVVGAESPPTPGGTSVSGGSINPARKYSTRGVASVEFPAIMASLFTGMSRDHPEAELFLDPEKLLARYGARVDKQDISYITEGEAEFWFAIYLFMRNWAGQFSSRIDLTFMPEVYPGMLVEIPDFKIQMYATRVEHSFDFEGGAFTTSVNVIAPSSTDTGGLFGMVSGKN